MNRVSSELKCRYLNIIAVMSSSRSNPSIYSQLDQRRQEIHEEILKEAGTTRDDTKFAMQLALFTEGVSDEELSYFR